MIIGICGFIGAGKDTAADYLVGFHGYRRDSFANTLKDAVSAVFGWDRELLEGTTKTSREWREQVDPWWAERLQMPDLTPRWILQHWGTEVCRNNFHQDIWVASVENKLRQSKDNIVITDCRFANEVNSLKNVGFLGKIMILFFSTSYRYGLKLSVSSYLPDNLCTLSIPSNALCLSNTSKLWLKHMTSQELFTISQFSLLSWIFFISGSPL